MNPQSKLKIVRLVPKPSKAEKEAMDQIRASWTAYHTDTGAPWRPYDGPTTPWTATVSASLDKGRYVVVVSEPRPPLWRKILPWWRMR